MSDTIQGQRPCRQRPKVVTLTDAAAARLREIMAGCFRTCVDAGSRWSADAAAGLGQKAGVPPSLLAGANVAGFVKVADAMRSQGDWW